MKSKHDDISNPYLEKIARGQVTQEELDNNIASFRENFGREMKELRKCIQATIKQFEEEK